jgi:hypothetical protein
VLHGRRLRPPEKQITLAAGDRVSLLLPAPQDPQPRHPGNGSRDHGNGGHADRREATSENDSA